MRNLVISSLIFLTFSSVFAQSTLDSGLVAYFPFSDNIIDTSGFLILDFSGFDNHGDNYGAILVADRNGNDSSALYFDGEDDIATISSYTNMSSTNEVSIAAWIKTDSIIAGLSWAPIYNRLETNDGYALTMDNTGHPVLSINGGQALAYSSVIVTDGQWHSVVGVYNRNAGNLKIYVDCNHVDSVSYSSQITYNPEPRNNIGAHGVNQNRFRGVIDELRIYNRALTTSEIQQFCILDTIVQDTTSQDTTVPNTTDGMLVKNLIESKAFISNGQLVITPSQLQLGIRVYNELGVLLYENRNYQNNWNVNGLKKGIYFYQLVGDEGTLKSTGSFPIVH